MKAAVYRVPGRVGIEEIPVPEVGPGEMLVALALAARPGPGVMKVVVEMGGGGPRR